MLHVTKNLSMLLLFVQKLEIIYFEEPFELQDNKIEKAFFYPINLFARSKKSFAVVYLTLQVVLHEGTEGALYKYICIDSKRN